MRVEDLLFRPFLDGLLLPAPVDDPLHDPVAMRFGWLGKIRHDPMINSACVVVQTGGVDPEGGWNTGVLVFRRIHSLCWNGKPEVFSPPSAIFWFEVAEAPIESVDGGFVFTLGGEVLRFDLRIEFESAEFYGCFVSGVGEHTSEEGEDGASLAPWVVNWDSRVQVACMSTLGEFGLPNFRV
jgi:hypothetical protein